MLLCLKSDGHLECKPYCIQLLDCCCLRLWSIQVTLSDFCLQLLAPLLGITSDCSARQPAHSRRVAAYVPRHLFEFEARKSGAVFGLQPQSAFERCYNGFRSITPLPPDSNVLVPNVCALVVGEASGVRIA